MTRLFAVLVLAFSMAACGPDANSNDGWLWSGPGTIRSIDWYHRSFVFEGDDHRIIAVSMCGTVPFWQGMKVEFSYIPVRTLGQTCCNIGNVRRLDQ